MFYEWMSTKVVRRVSTVVFIVLIASLSLSCSRNQEDPSGQIERSSEVVIAGESGTQEYALSEHPEKPSIYNVGDRMEEFVLKDTDGNNVALSQIMAKVIVLDVFASW